MDLNKIVKGIVTLVGVALGVALLWYLRSIVIYILVAAVLAIVGRPLVDRICRLKLGNWQVSRTLGASITLLLMWVVIGGFGILFIPLIVGKVNELLTIEGVEASFVAVEKNGGVNISARSMGAVNVQVILETLGGGGHAAAAGCTVAAEWQEAKQQILDSIRQNAPDFAE